MKRNGLSTSELNVFTPCSCGSSVRLMENGYATCSNINVVSYIKIFQTIVLGGDIMVQGVTQQCGMPINPLLEQSLL